MFWPVAVLVVVSGCIPLPFVAPPLEASVTLAPAGGNPPPSDDWADIDGEPFALVGRLGIYPAGFFEDLIERRIDAGAGVFFDAGPNRHFTYGGFGEFRVHPWVEYRGPAVWRASVHLTGDVLVHDTLGVGGGGSLGISFESLRFVSGDFAENNYGGGGVVGYGHGELGASVGIDGYVRIFDDAWWIGVGLRLRGRLPAAAGVALIPLY